MGYGIKMAAVLQKLRSEGRKVFSRRLWSMCWQLAMDDFKVRYTGSLLGLTWALLQPLLQLLIYSFLFSKILKVKFGGRSDIPHFALYVMAGFVPYQILMDAVSRSVNCVRDNVTLIRMGPRFPMKVLPIYQNLAALIQGSVWLLLLVIFASVMGVNPTSKVFFVPVLVLPLMAFCLGLSMLVAAANVYYRDTPHFLGLFLQFWLFGTPIFYPASLVPDGLRWLVWLNPMAYYAEMFRAVLLSGKAPGWGPFGMALGSAVLMLGVGYVVYSRYQADFIDQY